MTYASLGHRTLQATLDTTGQNPGNWTTSFDSAALSINVPYYELYHLYLSGPPGTSVQLAIDTALWDYQLQGQANGWDPAQPIILTPGNTVYFYWSTAATPAPTVTVWLRYDVQFTQGAF